MFLCSFSTSIFYNESAISNLGSDLLLLFLEFAAIFLMLIYLGFSFGLRGYLGFGFVGFSLGLY